ncbi:hypothetical protein HY339_02880 [Candidatus Gottesmanbacteria bacterium]|nr:hypothetical protein [Candidatus Gottesmanbacteria bacterium]
MKVGNPFKNLKLDAEEREIERPIEAGEATLSALKAKAIAEGLPYQTLAASVFHKYAMGA